MKTTLRKKIFFHFCLFMAVNSLIWVAGYYIDHLLKQKLEIIDKKSNLLNIVLEARRYEKNFFLSGDPTHLNQAIAYISSGEEKVRRIAHEHGKYTLIQDFDKNLNDLKAYKSALLSLSRNENEAAGPEGGEIDEFQQKKISDLGRKITEDIDQIVIEERKRVNQLLSRSRISLICSMGALLVLLAFTVLFLFVNVNGPLKAIEAAIRKIAVGDYTSIPRVSRGDEFESLVKSLNNMLNELNRRSEHLIQIEKLASLGTLTSGVAHELNNPLNNISTSVQIVLEELDDPKTEFKREMLMETEKQVDRARDIVKGLLEFSRQSAFNPRPVNLKALTEKTVRLMKGETPNNIAVHIDIPEDIDAELDPQRLQQVLINLIMNGVQSMARGGDLKVRAWEEKEEKGFYLQVKDGGAGIPEENLGKIFDPFFTTKEVGKGSGLGLSVSHGIIERHGGHITVDSRPGAGTTFTIFLPNESADYGGTEQSGYSDS